MELPDVVPAQVIASEHINDIRDRTIQRYASAAARASSNPSPAEGDLSYLNDSNGIYVYDGSAWVSTNAAATILPAQLNGSVASDIVRVGGTQDNSGPIGISTTMADRASIVFNKPASWATYFIMAWGSAHASSDAGNLRSRVEIGLSNGTTIDGQTASCLHQVASASGSPVTIALACAEQSGGGRGLSVLQHHLRRPPLDMTAEEVAHLYYDVGPCSLHHRPRRLEVLADPKALLKSSQRDQDNLRLRFPHLAKLLTP